MNFIDAISDSLFGGMSGAKQPDLMSLLGGILPGQAASGNPMGGLIGLLPGMAKDDGMGAAGGMALPGLMSLLGNDGPKAPAGPDPTLLAGLGAGLGGNGGAPAPRQQPMPPMQQPQQREAPVLANALGDILRGSGAMPGPVPRPAEQLPWSQPGQQPMNVSPRPAAAADPSKITGDDVASFIKSVMAGTAGVNPSAPGITAFAQGATGAISASDKMKSDAAAQKLAAEDRALKLEDRTLARDDKDFDRGVKTSEERRAVSKDKRDAKSSEIGMIKTMSEVMRNVDPQLDIKDRIAVERLVRDEGKRLYDAEGLQGEELKTQLQLYSRDLQGRLIAKKPLIVGSPAPSGQAPAPATPGGALGVPDPAAKPAAPAKTKEQWKAEGVPVWEGQDVPNGNGFSPKSPKGPRDKAEFDTLAPGTWFVNPRDHRILKK